MEKEIYIKHLRERWQGDAKEGYVFISYASQDWEKVYPCVLALWELGVRVFIDTNFQKDKGWLKNIENRLFNDDRCRAIVSFVSTGYLGSYACLAELADDLRELIWTETEKHSGDSWSGLTHPEEKPRLSLAEKQEPTVLEELVLQAAEGGSTTAMCNLGQVYHLGLGVKKSFRQSAQWYRKAAESNLADAQFALGLCCLSGKGMEQNEKQAVDWFRRAAEQGHANARTLLDELEE